MKPILFSLFIVLLASPAASVAQNVPSGMTYQGRLMDSSNAPVPDGFGYEIEVRLWTTATGGTMPMWAARYTGIPVKGGAFNLILGASGGTDIGGAIPDLRNVFAAAPTTYLGLTITRDSAGVLISNPTEILPRQQLFSTPYAFRSHLAANVDADAILSASIKDAEVKTSDIANGAVTLDKLNASSVDSSKVADLSLNSADIAVGGITMNRLATEYAIFIDEKSANANGGTAVAGWQTRTLTTTESLAGSSISRSGNVITLQPGTYFVDASAPSYAAGGHQAIFRKISDDSTAIRGTSENSDPAGNNASSRSVIRGYVTLSSPASFDIYHYTRSGNSNTGLGTGTLYTGGQRTELSVFTIVHIFKIK